MKKYLVVLEARETIEVEADSYIDAEDIALREVDCFPDWYAISNEEKE